MDLFGLKAKKKREYERKVKEAAEYRQWYQNRKKLIDKFLDDYNKKQQEIFDKEIKQEKLRVDTINSVCPKCGSRNVVNRFARLNGGKKNITLNNSYFSLDTLKINLCKDCTNEWAVEEPDTIRMASDFDKWTSLVPSYLFKSLSHYFAMSYNPDDKEEEFDSIEEKRKDYCDKCSKNYLLETYRNAPRYMVEYAFIEGYKDYLFFDKIDEKYTGRIDGDNYSYTFPEETWEIVKNIIGWNGPGEE